MRILFITNYYPPAKYGLGYMQLCEEVANGLAAKGHEIAVLTSNEINGEDIHRSYRVHRLLTIDPDWTSDNPVAQQFFFGRRQRERQTVVCFQRLLDEFEPQVVFIWHAIGLPKILLQEAERSDRVKAVYYLADYQPEIADEYIEYWKGNPNRTTIRLIKGILSKLALGMLAREGKPLQLNYEHVICVSNYVRQRLVSEGLIPETAVVIHNGVDLTHFSRDGINGKTDSFKSSGCLRCLVAGRIIPNKGVHTIVDAFTILVNQAKQLGISLTILGDGEKDYIEAQRKKIREYKLEDIIVFRPPIPRSQMPEALAQFDALILASEYEEPLARGIQEAMAMELLVIGTNTGGSAELLLHDQTGLVFKAGDPNSLAEKLLQAVANPGLVGQLRKAGREAVVKHFDIQKTVDNIEQYLFGFTV